MGIFTKNTHADDGDIFTKRALQSYRDTVDAIDRGDREAAERAAWSMHSSVDDAKRSFAKARSERQGRR